MPTAIDAEYEDAHMSLALKKSLEEKPDDFLDMVQTIVHRSLEAYHIARNLVLLGHLTPKQRDIDEAYEAASRKQRQHRKSRKWRL